MVEGQRILESLAGPERGWEGRIVPPADAVDDGHDWAARRWPGPHPEAVIDDMGRELGVVPDHHYTLIEHANAPKES